jgi:CRP-like cAMP-binding protein
VRTLVITDRSFRRLLDESPQVKNKVMEAMAKRLAPETL